MVPYVCRRCEAEEGTSSNSVCVCVCVCVCVRRACVWSFDFTQTYISGQFFLDPEDINILSLGAIWNFGKEQGSLDLVSEYGAQKARFKI